MFRAPGESKCHFWAHESVSKVLFRADLARYSEKGQNDMLLLCSVLCGVYVPGLVSGVPGPVELFFVFPGHFQCVKNRFGLSENGKLA